MEVMLFVSPWIVTIAISNAKNLDFISAYIHISCRQTYTPSMYTKSNQFSSIASKPEGVLF